MLSLTKGGITMATIKAFTDLQQSKKLAEILPIESSDMCFINDGTAIKIDANSYNVRKHMWKDEGVQLTPCWSISALLSILPEIQGSKPVITLDDNYITYPHMNDLHTKADNLVDACVAMIGKLHELKML